MIFITALAQDISLPQMAMFTVSEFDPMIRGGRAR